MTCRQPTFSALRSVTNPRQDRYMRVADKQRADKRTLQPSGTMYWPVPGTGGTLTPEPAWCWAPGWCLWG